MSMGRALCPDVNGLVMTLPRRQTASAIDAFYEATAPIVTRVNPQFFLDYGEDAGGLMFVGLISATENYFRDVLGFILTVCPKAQSSAAEEKVQLGSLLWAENDLRNRSAFEFIAFSSAENIKKAISRFACHNIRGGGSFDSTLREYDKLCELRHAIVHSNHLVAGKNAIKLGLRRTSSPVKVRLGYAGLQAAGTVCTSLVQSANVELFEVITTRWATEWRHSASWDPSADRALLRRVRSGFVSRRDRRNSSIVRPLTDAQLFAELQTEFNL